MKSTAWRKAVYSLLGRRHRLSQLLMTAYRSGTLPLVEIDEDGVGIEAIMLACRWKAMHE